MQALRKQCKRPNWLQKGDSKMQAYDFCCSGIKKNESQLKIATPPR